MRKYFVNHKEVCYREFLLSNEKDKMALPANGHFAYNSEGRLIMFNHKDI